jgi:ubiquinol-cytochrome c reductase iron-sulfur subunit
MHSLFDKNTSSLSTTHRRRCKIKVGSHDNNKQQTNTTNTLQPTKTNDQTTELDAPYDNMINDYQMDANRGGDTTNRAFTYAVVGSAKVLYASMARVAVIKMVSSLSASADVLALGSLEVDISSMAEGTTSTVKWRGKPVFFKHRTQAEIDSSVADDSAELRDPQLDSERYQKEKWMIVVGICTHLGCVPISNAGEYKGGWFCPCHGSHYDASGRIRKGPAPLNLEVPEYQFLTDTTVRIG